MSPGTPSVDRFLAKISISDTGCWVWTAAIDRQGYGRFLADGHWLAHRWGYSHFVGEIPKGLTIDHLCKNRKCTNPEHLEAVTMEENLRRGESFSSINRRKTHCIHGHLFDSDNTLITYNKDLPRRECKACKRDKARISRGWVLKDGGLVNPKRISQ